MKKNVMKTEKLRYLPTSEILPASPLSRGSLGDEGLDALAGSIARYGMLQPLLVQETPRGYRLLCGSRRLRAARILGMGTVPCRVMHLPPREAAELIFAENLHRAPLEPYEEGLTADRLSKRFAYRQGELAERVGMHPSRLGENLRIMRFSPEERRKMSEYGLSPHYAESLLHLRRENARLYAIEQIGRNRLSAEEAAELCLSLALHPEEFIPSLRQEQAPSRDSLRRFVVKDVGFFVNSVERAIGSIRQAGLAVESEKEEDGSFICYSIRIPKTKV